MLDRGREAPPWELNFKEGARETKSEGNRRIEALSWRLEMPVLKGGI